MVSTLSLAQAQEGHFEARQFTSGNQVLNYRMLKPAHFEQGKQYPLVVFLHGSGERGNDNKIQLVHGASVFTNAENMAKHPAIVIFPQCPKDQSWVKMSRTHKKGEDATFLFPKTKKPQPAMALVNELVDSLRASGQVNKKQVYVMGLSLGGFGTLDCLQRWPHKYAAAVVICGGNNPELAHRYRRKPIWFFHGSKDDIVPNHYSRAIYNKIKKYNSGTKYTLVEGANHNSWDSAFATPELLDWLFQWKK
ncbi:phospholipase (plasmid) [Persicobacter psychrovividus]|uniref:Phospholipase n=2 Tax=Persicobacter psychrovividus TaxID=387638 RepID=A0ABM7VI54_9BACT|nr:phospholipase [Persicobacter psychrovividus]